MFYKLLGMAVWNAGKLFLRRKYGRTYAPKPLIAGSLIAVVVGALLLVNAKRDSSIPSPAVPSGTIGVNGRRRRI